MVYEPIIPEGFSLRANEPVFHPWLVDDAPPVLLGVGRLAKQKDFPTLIRAFAKVRQKVEAKLIILGEDTEGNLQSELTALAAELGVGADVDFCGHVDNPVAYMSRARIFVLSSGHEGGPVVLIEALACGCAVVSTDIPGYAREFLQNSDAGQLVPVADPDAMAKAILAQLAQSDLTHPRVDTTPFQTAVSAEAYVKLCQQLKSSDSSLSQASTGT